MAYIVGWFVNLFLLFIVIGINSLIKKINY